VWLPDENSPGLAMSRAFGDFMLKDYGIIAIPEISHRTLTSSDQFIVLASDGVSVLFCMLICLFGFFFIEFLFL